MKRLYVTLSLFFLPLYLFAQFTYSTYGYDKHHTPDNIEMQQRTRNNLFLPGTRWYYDNVDIAIGLMRVDSYEVKDLVFDNYSEEYYDMGGWYMYDQDDRWYVRDREDTIYRLVMDFSGVDSFPIYGRRLHKGLSTFDYYRGYGYIDSVRPYTLPDNTVRPVYYVRYEGYYHLSDQTPDDSIFSESGHRVVKGIGFLSGGMPTAQFILPHPTADPLGYIGQLRCFSNDTALYKFVDYDCDSTWVLEVDTPEDPHPEVVVYPNPAHSTLYVKGIDKEVDYMLLDMATGRIAERGRTKRHSVALHAPGVYVLRLFLRDAIVTRKVVVMR